MVFLTITVEEGQKIDVLFHKFEKPLARYIFSIVKDNTLTEDIIQNVFFKIIKNIDKIEEVESKETKNYLYTIAHTTAIDEIKKKKSYESVTKPYDDTVITMIDEFHADEIIANANMSENLIKCIKQLSISDQDIIILKYGSEWDNDKLADYFEISEEAVRKRISRAKMRLAAIIKKDGGGILR